MELQTALVNVIALLESLTPQELDALLERLDLSDQEWEETFSTYNDWLNKIMADNLPR